MRNGERKRKREGVGEITYAEREVTRREALDCVLVRWTPVRKRDNDAVQVA